MKQRAAPAIRGNIMVHEEIDKIEKEQCEESGRMKLSALALTLQDVADHQLTPLSLRGYDIMKEGYMWVLVKRYMELKRFPREGEELKFYTWTAPARHGFCPRRYRAETLSGERVLDTVCQWVVIDMKERGMVAPPDFVDRLPNGKMEGELKMPKMPRDWPELDHSKEKQAVAEDIDANGHVNNSRYLAWAMEIWEEHFGKEKEPGKIMIEYTKEVMQGEVLNLRYAVDAESLHLRGEHDGNTNFSIIMKLA